MSITEKLKFSELNGLYGKLLTEHQRELLSLYFDCDVSLAELSEQFNVSRQAVRDAIVRGQRALTEFEDKLGIIDKRARLKAISEELKNSGATPRAISRLTELADEFYEEE